MTSKYEDFTPPRSNCTSDTRIAKACIGVTNKIQSNNDQRIEPEPKIKEKRTLSVYNIFYKEMRKTILAERGYSENNKAIQIKTCETPPNKRGRPRGPNYKKKNPHGVISFIDLTKEVAVRWPYYKDEYYQKYDAIVEEKKKIHKAKAKLKKKIKKSQVKHITPKERFQENNSNSGKIYISREANSTLEHRNLDKGVTPQSYNIPSFTHSCVTCENETIYDDSNHVHAGNQLNCNRSAYYSSTRNTNVCNNSQVASAIRMPQETELLEPFPLLYERNFRNSSMSSLNRENREYDPIPMEPNVEFQNRSMVRHSGNYHNRYYHDDVYGHISECEQKPTYRDHFQWSSPAYYTHNNVVQSLESHSRLSGCSR